MGKLVHNPLALGSNAEMIAYLKERNLLRTRKVENAFRRVDRAHFVLPYLRGGAYWDSISHLPQRQTISTPSVVSEMLESLAVGRGMKVLEVGTASGYTACLLAHLVGRRGVIHSIERHQELSDYAAEKIGGLGFKNIELTVGDGSKGHPQEKEFDRIIVHAAAPGIPMPLFDQLREGGRMIIPVGSLSAAGQELLLVRKVKGKGVVKQLLGVAFVPLVGEHGFSEAQARERH